MRQLRTWLLSGIAWVWKDWVLMLVTGGRAALHRKNDRLSWHRGPMNGSLYLLTGYSQLDASLRNPLCVNRNPQQSMFSEDEERQWRAPQWWHWEMLDINTRMVRTVNGALTNHDPGTWISDSLNLRGIEVPIAPLIMSPHSYISHRKRIIRGIC
jgi:hypothetical protein